MGILECHHFRLPVCRFVIDLFDKKVMRQIVLEEEDSDDDSDGSEEFGGENHSDHELTNGTSVTSSSTVAETPRATVS
jgi:rapamycin-insensitive companion of mTOR